MITNESLLDLSRWLSGLEKQELHHDANILYENSNNNENWHSRVLRAFFEYRDGIEYPILTSFINLVKRNAYYPLLDIPHNERIICSNEKDRIDLLVEIGNNSAIIIENKINWAADQFAQIERYVDVVRNNPQLDESKIYVIYLTADSSKTVENYSLTEKAKEWLKGTLPDESCHFLPLNYARDILPWLDDEILPNIKGKSNVLLSSVTLYVDFMKARFMRNESEQSITTKLIEKMEQENIKMKTLEDAFITQEQVSRLAERVNQAKEQKIKEVGERCVTTPLIQYLKELDPELKLRSSDFYLGYFNIIITHPMWKKCHIHLGDWQYKNYGGLRYDDPQNNSLSTDVLNELRNKFKGWKGDNNEPVWNYFDSNYRGYYTLESWKVIESGYFVKYINSFIKEIYNKVQEISI